MSVAPSPPPVDTRWEVVQRVAVSTSFQRSPRLRELLAYICERSIQNRPEELREQLIGCGVFGRKSDYNPGEDNIVRVEMRQLRKRLEEYFASEGKSEPYLIVIPKGSYVAVFEPREIPPAVAAAIQAPPGSGHSPVRHWSFWSLAAATLGLVILSSWLWNGKRASEQRLATAMRPGIERTALWPMLFNETQETLIVCADSSLVVAQALLHRSVSLEEYLSHELGATSPNLPGDTKALLRSMPNWVFTDMTDVRLVQRLFRMNSDHWDKVSVRSAKATQTQDFKNGNSVLLGSVRSNLWDSLFEPAMNFRFDYDEQAHTAFIRNMHPVAGEQPVYRAARPGQSGDSYSIVALVPNLRHTGYVLLIGGTTAEGTESAGEFIMNPASSTPLLTRLMSQSKGHIPYFELLLRSRTLAGVAKDAEIVAERILPGETPHN